MSKLSGPPVGEHLELCSQRVQVVWGTIVIFSNRGKSCQGASCQKTNLHSAKKSKNTRLSDGHRLLLHGLEERVVLAAHFVELVDAAATWEFNVHLLSS